MLLVMNDRLKTYQLEAIETNGPTAIKSTGIKIIACVAGSVPNHNGISIINLIDYLIPDHFTGSLGVTADVYSGSDFKKPNSKAPSQPWRGIVNRDDQHHRLTPLEWQ